MNLKKWAFKLNKTSLTVMLVSVLVNCGLGFIAQKTGIPFWLNGIGTVVTAISFGPLAGGIVGFLTGCLTALTYFHYFSYAFVWALFGIVVGYLFPRENGGDPYIAISISMIAGICSAAASTVLNLIFFDGYTNNAWGDALIDMLSADRALTGFNAFFGQALVEVPDRVLSMVIAIITVGLVKKKAKSTAAVALLFAAAMTAVGVESVEAVDFYGDYETVEYGAKDGLASIEINAIAQTQDGFIWAGSYSGLYRYDGNSFERFNVDDRIKNVMRLYVDSKNRLWIGTNDSGIFCYNNSDGTVEYYTSEDGLAADAIRAITEDAEGNIYVGTIGYTSVIDTNGDVRTYSEWTDGFCTMSFVQMEDGTMVGITNAGILYGVKDGEVLWEYENTSEEGVYFTEVAKTSDEKLLVGTSVNKIKKFSVSGKDLHEESVIDTGEIKYVNRLFYSELVGGYLICCENGLGFLEEKNEKVISLVKNGFDSSVSDAVVDKQGNAWFSSNKQGIIRFSWNPFENIFRKAGVEGDVVNSLLLKDNLLYIGQADGMKIIDMNTYQPVDTPYLSKFENVRVRQVMSDSSGNIWVSTYGEDGLVCIDPEGNTTNYNDFENGALGGRFRFSIELSDGRIVAASTNGLTFIQDGTVVATLGEDSGLSTTQILDVDEEEDGTLRVASDGDGVFIVKNDKVIDRIGLDDGLETLVVMKIVPCTDGYIYVTSNALYYDNGESIKRLENFPYSNNYDVYITDDGMCFVISSAGLYVVKEEDLLGDGDYSVTLLNQSRGFSTTLTSNAWYEVDGDDLYLCCSDGVRKISTKEYDSFDNDYQIGIGSIKVGNDEIFAKNGTYTIPATKGRIQIRVAVMNYSLSNPLVHVYLEGADDEGITAYQNELSELGYTNLPYGDYKLHVQIISESTGEVVRDEVFKIEKLALMYERPYFKIYLFLIGILLGMYVGWSIVYVRTNAARLRGLQREVSTDPMTGLYNKAASEKVLTDLCKNQKGVLLMIDLDSFKLVNDIYGHDMGDRILIRFSTLIKDAIGKDDMAGRIGGDEFIAYLKGDISEKKVVDIAAYLNERILESAREYMGEDMEIPLGTSIGAVMCPEEGDDFSELFRLADKALYFVKQNGKHGCDFYHKKSATEKAETIKENSTIDSLMKIMGERNIHAGAYVLKPDEMQHVYRFLCRYTKRYPAKIEFARIRMISEDKDLDITEDDIEAFGEVLRQSMRSCDILSRNGNQYLLLYTVAKHEDREVLIKRAITEWKEDPEYKEFKITYEVQLINQEDE